MMKDKTVICYKGRRSKFCPNQKRSFLISDSLTMLKETAKTFLPCFINGIVVKGFGRGSKQLGCPTGKDFIFLIRSMFKAKMYAF